VRGCGISWSSVTQRHDGAPRRPAMEFVAAVLLAAVVLYLLTQVEDLNA
jgi:prepilin signal peptidase PulO-like enzyme (type II secretory pathway)